jgi:O-antigen ligase
MHMHYLVPLIAALIPLIITPGLLSYFDITPKIVILLFGVCFCLLCSRENERNVRMLLSLRPGRWFAALLGAAWLSVAIATTLSLHPALSLNGGNWRRFGLVSQSAILLFTLLAGAWLAADRRNILTFLRTVCASGGVASIYGILQYFGWDPLLPASAYQAGEGPFTIVRPPGTLGHADYFAAWLIAIAFLSIALARLESERWRKTAAGVVCALAAVAIVLSGTRSALVGMCIGAALFLIVGRRRTTKSVLAIVLAGLAGLALFFVSTAGAKLRARLHWSIEDARGGARLPLWRDSVLMSMRHPIAGFGPESFAPEFSQFESQELARAFPNFYHESPHNIFLDALTTQGLFGLLVLLAICMFAVLTGITALRHDNDVSHPLIAAFAGILICQQFTVFIAVTDLYFFLIVGLLVACSQSSKPVHAFAPPHAAFRLLSPMGLVLGLFFACVAMRLLVADIFLATVSRRIQTEDARGAAQAYQVVLRWQPAGTASDLNYSRAMQQLAGQSQDLGTQSQARQQAMEAGIRATTNAEDRQNAWYNLAALFAAENNLAATERSLRNAIAWAPNWFKPHWSLAQLLEMTNRQPEALLEARAAVERDAGHDPQVAETLRRIDQEHRAK